ncbi:MAG: ornithine carbamoyltransferase [Planctomycetota bacterium]
MKHLTSLFDITPDQLHAILDQAQELKQLFRQGQRPQLFPGRVLVQLFEKPSLRTRNSFEAAMIHLGGSGIFLTTAEAGLNGRESLPDIARVISSFSDLITMRTFSQKLIEDMAAHASCPVINGLSDERHPCQALTDLLTIRETLASPTQRHLVFVGDGNNVAMSLAIAAAMTGMPMTLAAPDGFQFTADFLQRLTARYPTHQVRCSPDPATAVRTADIVYTDVWASMGQEDDADRRKAAFADFQVNSRLMSLAPSSAVFMHDLPAKRGLEVTDEVIDGPQSIVFAQAENRMHLAKGLFAWLLSR